MARPGYTTIIVEVYDSGRMSGKHGSRHIRPAEGQAFPQTLDVECGHELAASYEPGTQFRMDVCLKTRNGKGEHRYSSWRWKPELVKKA